MRSLRDGDRLRARQREDRACRRPDPRSLRAPRRPALPLPPRAHPRGDRVDDDDGDRRARGRRVRRAGDPRANRRRDDARDAALVPRRGVRGGVRRPRGSAGARPAGGREPRDLRAHGVGHAHGPRVRGRDRCPASCRHFLGRQPGERRRRRRDLAPALGLRLLPHRGPHGAPVRRHAHRLRPLHGPGAPVVRLLDQHAQRERARRRCGRDRLPGAGSTPIVGLGLETTEYYLVDADVADSQRAKVVVAPNVRFLTPGIQPAIGAFVGVGTRPSRRPPRTCGGSGSR